MEQDRQSKDWKKPTTQYRARVMAGLLPNTIEARMNEAIELGGAPHLLTALPDKGGRIRVIMIVKEEVEQVTCPTCGYVGETKNIWSDGRIINRTCPICGHMEHFQ